MSLQGIRTLVYYGICAGIMPFFVLALLIFAPFPFSLRYAIAMGWIRCQHLVLRCVVGLRYRVDGLENIPEGGAIIYCKHQSMVECITTQMYLPPQTWVVKRELMLIPVFGWGLALLKPIAIDRSAGRTAVDQIVEQGRKLLDQGIWIVIYPEGTRMPVGKTCRYGVGGATLAARTGYPIVPVAHNAGRFWLKGQLQILPGTFHMRVGPAIDSRGRSPDEINAAARQWMDTAMADIDRPEKEIQRPGLAALKKRVKGTGRSASGTNHKIPGDKKGKR